MKLGVVCRINGDIAIAGAIADGMAQAENVRLVNRIERVERENDELRARLGVMACRDSDYWGDKIAETRRKYRKLRRNRRSFRLLDAVWGLYGLLILAVGELKKNKKLGRA